MFLVAFDGTNPRLTSGLQKMMAQFEALFGRIFWDNAEMLITKWPMDQHSQVRSQSNTLVSNEKFLSGARFKSFFLIHPNFEGFNTSEYWIINFIH